MITSSSLHRRGTSLSYHIDTEKDDDDHYSRNLNTNESDDSSTVPPTPQEQHSVFDDTVNLDLMMTTTTKKTVDDTDHVGAIGLSVWMISLCAFVFVNNFIGPWPQPIYD